MRRRNQISIVIMMSSIVFISSIKPSLSHSGSHQNSSPIEAEQKEKSLEEQNKIKQKTTIEKIAPQNNETPKKVQIQTPQLADDVKQVSPNSKNLETSSSATFLKQFDLIPSLTELIFFLLLASPFLLYRFRNNMYKRRSN